MNSFISFALLTQIFEQGSTIEEAIAGLREATRLYLEEFPIADIAPRYVTNIAVSYA